jgi:hypothetical protein
MFIIANFTPIDFDINLGHRFIYCYNKRSLIVRMIYVPTQRLAIFVLAYGIFLLLRAEF